MIDPHIEAVLAAMAESGFTLPDPITPASMREFLDNPIPGPPIEIEKQQDLTINTPDGGLPARLYHPAAGSVLPVVLFFHGGGWVHGTLDMYDRMCAALAVQTECAVVSVDYRLAPENPFPAAWSDALASLLWIKDNHVGLGVDPSRIALVGDSAGGNLAAALAQNAANDPAICCQVLFYPALDGRCDSPSFKAEHAGFFEPCANALVLGSIRAGRVAK